MTSNPTYAESRKVAEASRDTTWKLPSFGKGMFLGDYNLDLIHPAPPSDDEMAARAHELLGRVRGLLSGFDPIEIDKTGKLPDELIKAAMDMGLLGIKTPKEYGGLGFNQYWYNKILGGIGTQVGGLAVMLSAHQSVGMNETLLKFGTEEQKREWLPKVSSDHLSTFALTEPDVGSDPARVSSTAVPTEDGEGYIINGEKLWATNGTLAKVMVVVARVPQSEGHKGGLTAFICPTDTPGIETITRNEFMGLHGIENSLTKFTDVRVPRDSVIGNEGQGLKIALTCLNTGRLSIPALCTAASKYALLMAREFGAGRRQWGAPIGKHDAVAQKLAFIAASAFGVEALVDLSSRIADAKSSDVRIEAAIAKLYGAEMGWQIVDAMVQVRGGRGYETAESLRRRGEIPFPAEQLLRDMRINRIFEGSSEVMKLLIAREAVDTHLAAAGDILEAKSATDYAKAGAEASRFYVKWLPKLAVGKGLDPRSYKEFGPLAEHLRWAERASRRLASNTFGLMARYQGSLEQKGHLLGRIVDIGCEIYAVTAACIHAERLGRETPERRESAYALAALFCRQARRRAEATFTALWQNDDKADYADAQRLLAGDFLWFEDDVVDPTDLNKERPATTA